MRLTRCSRMMFHNLDTGTGNCAGMGWLGKRRLLENQWVGPAEKLFSIFFQFFG
jgi:hypothetical protein